jgi:CheY-like chemotaxis protein
MQKNEQILNKDFISFVCVMARDPKTWADWKCIDISIDHCDNQYDNKTILSGAQSLIESYLVSRNIHCFLCPPHNLYVLIKNIETSTIQELEDFITNLVHIETEQRIYFQIYSFDKDQDAFLSKIQEQGDVGPLTIPQSNIKSIENFIPNKETKALLIEDDPVTRWIVRTSLKDECDLMTASTASSACVLYSKFKPDIVFLDINLPDKSGLDVLNWILRHDPGAKIVMFSSQDSLDIMTSSLEAGAIGFIAKPFTRDHLITHLRYANKRVDIGNSFHGRHH